MEKHIDILTQLLIQYLKNDQKSLSKYSKYWEPEIKQLKTKSNPLKYKEILNVFIYSDLKY